MSIRYFVKGYITGWIQGGILNWFKGGSSVLPDTLDIDFKEIEEFVYKTIFEHFEQDQGPLGTWQDLKPDTWAYKTTGKMLYESGKYFRSWKAEVKPDMITFESASPLAKWHELGTHKMPERSFVWLSESEVNTIAQMVADQLEKAIDNA